MMWGWGKWINRSTCLHSGLTPSCLLLRLYLPHQRLEHIPMDTPAWGLRHLHSNNQPLATTSGLEYVLQQEALPSGGWPQKKPARTLEMTWGCSRWGGVFWGPHMQTWMRGLLMGSSPWLSSPHRERHGQKRVPGQPTWLSRSKRGIIVVNQVHWWVTLNFEMWATHMYFAEFSLVASSFVAP